MANAKTVNRKVEAADAISNAQYRFFCGIALLGIEIGELQQAERLAAELHALRPDLPHALGVAAMSQVVSGRPADAARQLQDVLVKWPDFQLGKALLAMVMRQESSTGWQAMLEDVLADGRDEHAVGLAAALLGRAVVEPEAAAANEPAAFHGHALWV